MLGESIELELQVHEQNARDRSISLVANLQRIHLQRSDLTLCNSSLFELVVLSLPHPCGNFLEYGRRTTNLRKMDNVALPCGLCYIFLGWGARMRSVGGPCSLHGMQ